MEIFLKLTDASPQNLLRVQRVQPAQKTHQAKRIQGKVSLVIGYLFPTRSQIR
jgi:hypothetical protein